MIRVAICDDNNAICSEIEKVILEYQKHSCEKFDMDIFYTGESLIRSIENEHSFDIIFLDIELGSTTGIEVGNKIRTELDDYISKIVFITSKDGYEQQLFDIQPLNFIKKPLDHDKIKNCINLSIKLLGVDNNVFEYKKGYEITKVKIKDILYFEKVGRKMKIVTTYGEDFFNETILSIKNKLPQSFIEPHASFLVDFNKIIKLKNDFIIMADSKEIPVSRRNLQNIRTMLIDSEKEK